MVSNLIIIIILIIISSISKSIMDKLQFHYDSSIFKKMKNQKWWNPSISHLNKYKNEKPENGRKFLGSTTFLVFLTDAWHFFQEIFLNSLIIAILIAINTGILFHWWYWIVGFLILKLLFGTIFELSFSKILKY